MTGEPKTLSKQDEIILDMLLQVCGEEDGKIDNRCMSSYEHACEYLFKKHIIGKLNSRMYTEQIEVLQWSGTKKDLEEQKP